MAEPKSVLLIETLKSWAKAGIPAIEMMRRLYLLQEDHTADVGTSAVSRHTASVRFVADHLRSAFLLTIVEVRIIELWRPGETANTSDYEVAAYLHPLIALRRWRWDTTLARVSGSADDVWDTEEDYESMLTCLPTGISEGAIRRYALSCCEAI